MTENRRITDPELYYGYNRRGKFCLYLYSSTADKLYVIDVAAGAYELDWHRHEGTHIIIMYSIDRVKLFPLLGKLNEEQVAKIFDVLKSDISLAYNMVGELLKTE